MPIGLVVPVVPVGPVVLVVPIVPVVGGTPLTVELLVAPVGGVAVVDVPTPPTVEPLAPPTVELPVVAPPTVGPPTVELYGVVAGSPGFARFTPGVVVPVIDVDGVPIVEPDVVCPEVPSVGVDSDVPDGVLRVGVPGDDSVLVDEVPVDGVLRGPPGGGVSCDSVGARSVGISGRDVVVAGAALFGRTRSPSGMPASACRPPGPGPAKTNSDATASAAR